ncbi:alpha/beta hydrolase [uncultured Tateyamaria sp.]|uniref:alpha/beta fold hydrolase n=1 Tax=uncultured Tateyamaria sp. TaxID=455651 RepID=UPI002622983D|nr:alpha/beta hydrolase [uncultured Tateyamaria sp.]
MTFSYQPIDQGNAAVVALHSSASSSSQWRRLADDLKDRFNVHAFDLPGYGRAPLVGDFSQKGGAFSATPVISAIEEIGGPVHLVGHSNGGGIAIKVALMRPDLVKSLTLYEPAAFHFLKGRDVVEQRLFAEIQSISAQVNIAALEDDVPAGMQHFLDFWNGDGFWAGLPDVDQQRFAGMISSIMTDFAHGFAETWTLSDLSNLSIPALVMTGLDSPDVTQHVSVAIAKALPKARIALLPELGHMAPIFQPDWVNSRILEHVASVERPAAPCRWPRQVAA